MEAVERLGGCPRVVRGDLGTENGHVRDFQRFLYVSHEDESLDSYLEGASTANQRIEHWWGVLRKECVEFWISLFADLRDKGFFDGGFLDKSLLQFCCMGLIQVSLKMHICVLSMKQTESDVITHLTESQTTHTKYKTYNTTKRL